MKNHLTLSTSILVGAVLLSSCSRYEAEDNYLVVIGEYEQQSIKAGYRLNLSYNGPMEQHDKFEKWADSLKQEVPGMVKMNESIYMNHMPEEMNARPKRDSYHTSATYVFMAADSALYNRIADDLLEKGLPFNLNVMGTYMEPAQKAKLQQDLLQKALENAKDKLAYLSGKDQSYEIVGMEELDNTMPFGPEYYKYNRRMVARVKVKARLN